MASLAISDGSIKAESAIKVNTLFGQGDQNSPGATGEASNEGTQLMDVSARASHHPPVLHTLSQLTCLLVQKEEDSDYDHDICFSNYVLYKYEVKDHNRQKIFTVKEDDDPCLRQCFGPARSFTMHVKDITGREVITLLRPGVCNCWRTEMEVQRAPGIPIGYVISNSSTICPRLTIENERREPVLKIAGESCMWFLCCCSLSFQVTSLDGTIIGNITIDEMRTEFQLQFPLDMDVTMKAVILGACVFIDQIYFGEMERGLLY